MGHPPFNGLSAMHEAGHLSWHLERGGLVNAGRGARVSLEVGQEILPVRPPHDRDVLRRRLQYRLQWSPLRTLATHLSDVDWVLQCDVSQQVEQALQGVVVLGAALPRPVLNIVGLHSLRPGELTENDLNSFINSLAPRVDRFLQCQTNLSISFYDGFSLHVKLSEKTENQRQQNR